MENRIELSMEAEEELDGYVEYYEQQVEGLGQKFRKAVNDVLETLQSFPAMQVRYDAVRCVPVKGFPFMLHYSVIDKRKLIRIHAIIHTSRNPGTTWNNNDWILNEPKHPAYGLYEYDLEYYYAA